MSQSPVEEERSKKDDTISKEDMVKIKSDQGIEDKQISNEDP